MAPVVATLSEDKSSVGAAGTDPTNNPGEVQRGGHPGSKKNVAVYIDDIVLPKRDDAVL